MGFNSGFKGLKYIYLEAMFWSLGSSNRHYEYRNQAT